MNYMVYKHNGIIGVLDFSIQDYSVYEGSDYIVFSYSNNDKTLSLELYPPYEGKNFLITCIDIFSENYDKYHDCNSIEQANDFINEIIERANKLMVFS